MPSENILRLKEYYENGEDNIGRDFIRPCLKECSLYRRGAAFFGSSAFVTYADALLHVIKDNVKIEILCSPVINDNRLLETLSNNLSEEERINTIQQYQESIIYKATKYKEDPNHRGRFGSEILAYLIANSQLEIKTAIRKSDGWPEPWPTDDEVDEKSHLYHVKRGYFVFENDKKLAFDGSFNETLGSQQLHTETAQIYKMWKTEDQRRGENVISRVDRDWNEENKDIYIRPLSKDLIEKIKQSASRDRPKIHKPFTESIHIQEPTEVNEEQIIERPYQKEALDNWKKNNYKGILAMATGSGKTRTAISAIKEIKQEQQASLIVVVVPKINLALQWIEEFKSFGMKSIGAFTNQDWPQKIDNEVLSLSLKQSDYNLPIFVVVRDTFVSGEFKDKLEILINETENFNKLIVVDECHHFNKRNSISQLPDTFNYRLGLSATPFNQYEEEQLDAQHLYKYFNKTVFEYTLKQALDEGYLTQYNYYVVPVTLNEEETDILDEISIKIARAYSAFLNNDSDENRKNLDRLNAEKNRLISNVKDKLSKLEDLIKNKKKNYALAYCGASSDEDSEGVRKRHIQRVSKIFYDQHWRVGKITSDETIKQRVSHIQDLQNGLLNVIVSIKVLDEGIDIPCCKIAYILASSKSNREFIQRRGRVLRLFDGKDEATIYDFVITAAEKESDSIQQVIKDEYYRVNEFAKLAKNKDEIYNKYNKELAEYV